jgi:hypothetical protein
MVIIYFETNVFSKHRMGGKEANSTAHFFGIFPEGILVQ